MIRFFVDGVGLYGPGLEGWAASLPILAGGQDYAAAGNAVPASTLLPGNERRRAVQIVKIAIAVGEEAFAASGCDPAATATVFASSGGDGVTIHEILSTLASPIRELSPTRFHNSVHNAASGYWSIATGSRAASSSLGCHDDSFAAGLLEAAVQAADAQSAVGLIAYDVPYPIPLNVVRPIGAAFGVAIILSPVRGAASLAEVTMELRTAQYAATPVASPKLEALRLSAPAARCLPFLTALAKQEKAEIVIGYLEEQALFLNVAPVAER